MEIAVLLLLIVPLTSASSIKPPHRAEADIVLPEITVEASAAESLEDTKQHHVQAVKIIPFHAEDKHLDLDTLKHSLAMKLRPRRAPQRGCQFGTCHTHNLANTLHELSKSDKKDVSENSKSPHGYGR